MPLPDEAASDSPSPGRDPPDRRRVVVAAVVFEGALAVLALVLGRLFGRSPLEGFAWDARDALLGVLATLPMYAAFRLAMRRPFGPMARIRRFFDEEMAPLLGGRPAGDLAMIALAAGMGEELLFRGLLQGGLTPRFGTWTTLAVSSLLFGLLHPVTPAYVVIAGLLGAYLGAVWVATGNLLTVIVAHALYDFLALRDLLPRGDGSAPDPGRTDDFAAPGG